MIRSAWSDEIRKHSGSLIAGASTTVKRWNGFLCQEIWSFPRWFIPLFIAVLALRILFCTQPPLDTTDLFRHLGFTSHFYENPQGFYYLKPEYFSGELWALNWPETVYIYPPLTLLFFSFFGKLGIGFFWVKLALTFCDVLTTILIGKSTSWVASMLIFAAPASIWYTSHEGQYECLTNLLVVLSILFARLGKWKCAGAFFMLALQTKQLAIFIFPYLIFEALIRPSRQRVSAFFGMIHGLNIIFLVFLPFYYWRHDLWLLPLKGQIANCNPFFWPVVWNQTSMISHFGEHPQIFWNSVVTMLPLCLIALLLIQGNFWRKLPQVLPLVGFYSLLKSLSWAMYWYMNMVPGFALAISRYKLTMILILITNCFVCKDMISIARYDLKNQSSVVRECFKRCIWCCDYSSIK
jgi:hypothetical protein